MKAMRHKTAQRSYEAVLLGIYLAADDAGLYCLATNAEIGAACGRTADTVKSYLPDLERLGEILVFRRGEGVERRTIIILDHPESGRAVSGVIRRQRLWAEEAAIARGDYA